MTSAWVGNGASNRSSMSHFVIMKTRAERISAISEMSLSGRMILMEYDDELPKAPAEPMGEQNDEPLIVSVKADGSLYINVGDSDKPRLLDDVTERMRKVMKQKPETKVLVWGDEAVRYGEVVTLMAALQSAGAPSVGLVTENPR